MISFFTEDTDFNFREKSLTRKWLKAVTDNEYFHIGNISIIFCSDPYLLDINKKYLQHEYYTDIITFDYSQDKIISGDLFISVDTVKENSSFYGTSFEDELRRVIVHGVLHLIGYDDHTEEDQKQMREKENYYLECRNSMML